MSMDVANRYARALSEVLGPQGDYRTALSELQDFAAASRESADLREVMETPAVTPPDKLRVLDAILARMGISKTVSNFLRVLLENYRMNFLQEIVGAFRKVADDREGLIRVKVLSATGFTEAERQALRERFERLTQKKVECEFSIDPALIGGVVAQAGSTVYDGSVRGQLERVRRRLLEA